MDSIPNDCLLLDGQPLTLAEIEAVSLTRRPVDVAPAALSRVAQGSALIEEILASGETVYGVNTGFGKLSDVRIPAESLAQLQTNLVRSHAGGMGQPLSEPESRAMLLLRQAQHNIAAAVILAVPVFLRITGVGIPLKERPYQPAGQIVYFQRHPARRWDIKLNL